VFRVRVKTGAAQQTLGRYFSRATNLTPVLTSRVAPDQIESTLRNFEVGGRPTAWRPLSPSTIARKGSSKPLMDKGFLRRSVRKGRVTSRAIEIQAGGGAAPYAGIHQFGARRGPVFPRNKKALWWKGLPHPVKSAGPATIPARPFLVWLPEDLARHQASIRDYILRGGK